MKKYGWSLLLIVLIPLVFQKAFMAPYVLWDDDALVLNNPLLKLPFWDALKTAFSVYYHGDYFPITLMSYWCDYALVGNNSFFQHVENLFLHVLAVMLLFGCLQKLTKNLGLSFLVCLVFAIHPLQTETVMWISERKSLLAAVFTFLSLRFYMQSQGDDKKSLWYFLALVFFVVAGLSKATALLMPVLFLMLDTHHFGDRVRVWGSRLAPLVLAGVVLIALRVQAYTASVGSGAGDLISGPYLLTVPVRAFNALGVYLRFFLVPVQSSAIYPDFAMSAATLATAASMLLISGAVTIWIWRSKNFLAGFAWAWFLLFLLPVLQIFPRINYINERYMYLPIVGLAMLIFHKLKTQHQMKVAVVLGVLMAGLAFARSQMWTSNRALWIQTLNVVPESSIALNNLGLDYQNAGEFGPAVELYNRVLQLSDQDTNKILAYNNLANIYANSHFAGYAPAKAIALLSEGIARARRIRDGYEMRVNLGSLYRALGKNEEAREVLAGVLSDLRLETDYKFQWLIPTVEQQLRILSTGSGN